MKTILTAPVCLAVLLLAGCAGADRAHQDNAAAPVYETAEQIKAMPACTAKVIERAPCYVGLKTSNGKRIYIGSPGSKAEITRFLPELKEGQVYSFPDVFVRFQAEEKPL